MNRKYIIFLGLNIVFLSLCLTCIPVNSFQYIGEKQLCCIDSVNLRTCLNTNESIDLTSDITCQLYEKDYEVSVNTTMDLMTMVMTFITCIVILWIFILILRRK